MNSGNKFSKYVIMFTYVKVHERDGDPPLCGMRRPTGRVQADQDGDDKLRESEHRGGNEQGGAATKLIKEQHSRDGEDHIDDANDTSRKERNLSALQAYRMENGRGVILEGFDEMLVGGKTD